MSSPFETAVIPRPPAPASSPRTDFPAAAVLRRVAGWRSSWSAAWLEVWATERRWLLLRLACALVWAAELFCFQQFPFAAVPWIKYPVVAQGIRFYLDLLVSLGLALLVQRRYLVLLLGCNLLGLTIAGTYAVHFHWPMMPVRALAQWREGWSLHAQFGQIVSWPILTLAGGLLALKAGLLFKSGPYVPVAALRRQTALLLLLACGAPVVALQSTNLRLSVNPNGGMGRTVYVYGYLLPWVCDSVGNRDLAEHVVRARSFLGHHYDRLSPVESPLPVPGHVVVLQLESVGGSAIGALHQDAAVMPFLRELKNQSMYFRLQAFHRNGSCDMDYAATTMTEPYPGLVPYRLPGLTYSNALPAFMQRQGFATYLFHGNTGLFYDRSLVLAQVGFDHLLFKEQLGSQHLAQSLIGIRDAEVFGCARRALEAERRAFVFVITLDTHTPFQQLTPQEMELFPEPASEVERYLNALRYLDNCLREFVGQLPQGTTVVMYGDHTASIKTSSFHSDVVDGKEYVGCLIYEKGCDLALRQQTRNQPLAVDGSLNLLDVLSFVRHSVEVQNKLINQPLTQEMTSLSPFPGARARAAVGQARR